MAFYLGIDTSNYTTSVALLEDTGRMIQRKRLLPVKEGEMGMRQSDAVFEHTRLLPELVEEVFTAYGGVDKLAAIGASTRPRDAGDSYMPCFLAGTGAARTAAMAAGVPFIPYSHQAGHIAAALYSTGNLALMHRNFICFHFSGGTTECLHVAPDPERIFNVHRIATTLDLKAGQAVDRVGHMLGLRFPAGEAVSELACESGAEFEVEPSFKGSDVSLSGVENKCAAMLRNGVPAQDVAKCCISYICAAADRMTENALRDYGNLPVVYAGGVMSSRFIRERLEKKYGGAFAAPEFSSDNAAGIAVLTRRKGLRE